MLQVDLHNFRSHSSRSLSFNYPGSNHLQGPNGAGKSDFYRAIAFALFPSFGSVVRRSGTNTPARVTLNVPGIGTITRVSAQNAVTISVGDKTLRGDEAEQFITRAFGHRNLWSTCSHFNSCTHPFISGSAAKKIEMINNLIGNNDSIKAKLAAKLSDAKVEMNTTFSAYNTRKIQHMAVHGSDFASVGKDVLDESELTELESSIEPLKESVRKQESDLLELQQLRRRENVLSEAVRVVYTQEELNALTALKEQTEAYSSAEGDYRKAIRCPHGAQRPVPVSYAQQAIDECVRTWQAYETNAGLCERLRVDYKEEAVASLIVSTRREIEDAESAQAQHKKEMDEYIRLQREDDIRRSKLSKLITDRESYLRSLHEAEKRDYRKQFDEVRLVLNLIRQHEDLRILTGGATKELTESKIESLSRNLDEVERDLSYTHLFETHSKLRALRSMLKELEVDLPDKEYVERSISNRDAYLARERYKQAYLQLLPAPVHQGRVGEEIYKLRHQIQDIKRSSVARSCPHCCGSLMIVRDTIVKYEGVVVEGDVDYLSDILRDLEKLSDMRCPEITDEPIDTTSSVEKLRQESERIKKVAHIRTEISRIADCDSIPDGITYIKTEDAKRQIESLKKSIAASEKTLLVLEKLDILGPCPEKPPMPVVPPSLNLLDDSEYASLVRERDSDIPVRKRPLKPEAETSRIASARSEIEMASRIEFVAKPEAKPEYMRACTNLAAVKARLDSLAKPSKKVTSKDVLDYASGLGVYNQSLRELEDVRSKSASITSTEGDLTVAREELESALLLIDSHCKSVVVRDSYNVLKRLKGVYVRAKKKYDNFFELKELVEAEQKGLSADFLQGIERDINSFIAAVGADVHVNIVYTDKIKLLCYSKDMLVGKPIELSDGERSLLSFATTMAFAIQSPSPVIILDEVTDKLSAVNKAAAMEVLLESLQASNKCLLITDHNCDCGDFDNIVHLRA